jgi:TP901 family phage tail tape measure protein
MSVIGSVKIGVTASTGQFHREMDSAADRLKQFNGGAMSMKTALAALGTGFAAMKAVEFGKSAITQAADMETAIVGLGKATDLGGPALQAMKDEIFGLSTSLKGVSLDSLMEIATTGAKLGVAAPELMEYTRGVAMISAAMDDIPAAEIADKLGGVNSVFKLGTQGTLQLGSAIDKLADSGASSSQGIMDVSTRVASTAAGANIAAPAVLALGAALLDTKMGAELAGSSINRLINSIGDTSNAAKFAEAMGITADQFSTMVATDPTSAIQGFLNALKSKGGNEQNKILMGVGIEGTEGISAVKTLALKAEDVAKYVGLAKHEFATLDQIQKSYNATAETTNAGWTQMQNKVQVASVALGSAMMPAVNATMGLVMDLGTGIAGTFARSGSIISEFVAGFGVAGIDMGGVIADLGMGFRALPDFIEIAGIKIAEVFTNMGIGISTDMQNLARFGDYIAGNWSSLVIDGVNAVGSVFQNLGVNLASFGTAFLEMLKGNGFQMDWTPMLDGFQATAAALPEMLKPAYISMQDQIDAKFLEIGQRAEEFTRNAAGPKLVAPGAAPAMAAAGGAASDADNPFYNPDPSGEFAAEYMQKAAGPKLAGALELGSAEARSSILSARGGGEGKGIDGVARNTKGMLTKADQQLVVMREIATSVKGGMATLPI